MKVGAECLGCHRQRAPAILRKTTLMIMRWLIILRLHRNELTCGHELCLRHMNWLRHELYLRYIISGRVRRGRFLRATNVVSNLTVNSRIIKENDINDNALAHHSTLAQE